MKTNFCEEANASASTTACHCGDNNKLALLAENTCDVADNPVQVCDVGGVITAAIKTCYCGSVKATEGDHCSAKNPSAVLTKKCAAINTEECGSVLVDGVCIVEKACYCGATALTPTNLCLINADVPASST